MFRFSQKNLNVKHRFEMLNIDLKMLEKCFIYICMFKHENVFSFYFWAVLFLLPKLTLRYIFCIKIKKKILGKYQSFKTLYLSTSILKIMYSTRSILQKYDSVLKCFYLQSVFFSFISLLSLRLKATLLLILIRFVTKIGWKKDL